MIKVIPVSAMRAAMRRASMATLMRTVINSRKRIRAGLTGAAKQTELNRITAAMDEIMVRKLQSGKSKKLVVHGRPSAKVRALKKAAEPAKQMKFDPKILIGLLLLGALVTQKVKK